MQAPPPPAPARPPHTHTHCPLRRCYDHYVEMASASMVFSVLLSVGSYAASFQPKCVLAAGGDTGNAVYDFFIGRAWRRATRTQDASPMPSRSGGLRGLGWTLCAGGPATQGRSTRAWARLILRRFASFDPA